MFDLHQIAQLFRSKRKGRSELGGCEVPRGSRCRSIRVGFHVDGGYRHRRFTETIVVGSDPTCDLRLADRDITCRHAEIYRLGDRWWVRDLGSTDGTYLDEEIVDAAPVGGRAVVRLGPAGPKIWLDTRNRQPATTTVFPLALPVRD